MCKLKRSLYGLNQASRQWNSTLTSALIKKGFTQSTAGPSLFVKNYKGKFLTLNFYVDDVILASNYDESIKDIKDCLHEYFSIKYLGKLKFILDIKVARSNVGIHIYQRKYTLNLLAEYRFIYCKLVNTPIIVDKEDYNKTKKLENNTKYHNRLGNCYI